MECVVSWVHLKQLFYEADLVALSFKIPQLVMIISMVPSWEKKHYITASKSIFLFSIQRRTHSQLFLQLIEDIANTMDDVDYPGLGKGFVSQDHNLLAVSCYANLRVHSSIWP